jgi:PKD repeat protein
VRFSVALSGVAATFVVIGSAFIPAAMGGPAKAAPAPASALYVDPPLSSCSDSGAGTQAVPFCTLQHAADVVNPGQTVVIEAVIGTPVTISRSGTQGAPITFTYAGTIRQYLEPAQPTGQPVVTIKNAQYVTLSGLGIIHWGGDDGIDVIGSSGITLNGLTIQHEFRTAPEQAAAGISIDGTSSDVTVTGTRVNGLHGDDAIVAQAGAQQVTLATNFITGVLDAGILLDGTTDAVVTGNTVIAVCQAQINAQPDALELIDGTSVVAENNVLEAGPVGTCAPGSDLLADQASVSSAGGVTADYNAFATYGTGSSDYSWDGVSYSSVAAFQAAVPGQGAHDILLPGTVGTLLPEGSPAIDSANCAAPGYTSTDLNGNARVQDPLATDASLGNGTCYADRGAFERQDSLLPITATPAPVNAAGASVGVLPFTFGETITSPATTSWGVPVAYSINFGDGTPALPATPGTPASHPYTTEGQYTLTVTATSTDGLTKTATGTVDALGAQPHTPVLAVTPYVTAPGGSYVLDSAQLLGSYNGVSNDWEVASSTLTFGDGQGLTAMGSTHTYSRPGTYTATLTVTDLAGRTTTTKAPVTVGDTIAPAVPGRVFSGTIPAHGVVSVPGPALDPTGAALVNVIVTSAKASGYVTVYPAGTTRPSLATVQFRAGQEAANSTLARGTADIYNASAAPVTLQLVRYGAEYTANPASPVSQGDSYIPVTPFRVLNATKIAGGRTVTIPVRPQAGGEVAVVLDVTSSSSAAAGNTITWADLLQPYARQAGVFWAKGQPVTGLTTVYLTSGADTAGQFTLENASTGTATFNADVVGYYTSPAVAKGIFIPASPSRLSTVTIASGHSVKLAVSGKDGVPATGTTAAMVNLTATGATANGAITAYADGTPRPPVTSLSYSTGSTVAGAAIVAVGKDGSIDLYNSGSKPVTIAVDLYGSYYSYP